ncbi:hypothetical protein BH11PLA1_BH11PLA1_06120 [soil metagenome]
MQNVHFALVGRFGKRKAIALLVTAGAACSAHAQPLGQMTPVGGSTSAAATVAPSAAATSATTPSAATTSGTTTAAEIPPAPTPLVISTDRPSFGDGTGIQPLLHLNIETGYTFTFRDRDEVETQRHNGPEVLARFGLIDDRLEVRFATSGYVWSRTDDSTGSGFQAAQGFSDVALGLKLKLTDQDGWLPRLAFEPLTTLGTGARETSNREVEPTLKLLWSYDLGMSFGDAWKGVTVGGNLNIAFPTTNGDRFTQGQGAFYLNFPIIDKMTGFAEYFVIGPNTKGSDAAHYVDFGAVYLVGERVQIDARVGVGLNRQADSVFVGAGVSFLF